jgi:hypothetical protein
VRLFHSSVGFQTPLIRGRVTPEDIQIAIIGSHFEEFRVRAVPSVENLLYSIAVFAKLEARGAFVRFATGIALHVDADSFRFTMPTCVQ